MGNLESSRIFVLHLQLSTIKDDHFTHLIHLGRRTQLVGLKQSTARAALLPHKIQDPTTGSTGHLSVQSLHVNPVSARVSSGYSDFLP